MQKFKMMALFSMLVFSFQVIAKDGCVGRFLNPISDVCWSCMFPIKIGALTVSPKSKHDMSDNLKEDLPKSPICTCPNSPPFPPSVGITLGFWEPARLVDVTRKAWCFPSLGGAKLDPGLKTSDGVISADEAGQNTSFYHVHYYISPLLVWLNLLTDVVCLEQEGFDVAYISELDPTWDDDELNLILNPEAALFANPVSVVACMGDCASATAGKPLDAMFWCAGCQGSVYPLNGHVQAHVSGVQASAFLLGRVIYKLHRIGLLWGTMGKESLCKKYYMPIWRKSMYRTQMTYPVPGMSKEPFPCNPVGRSTALWESGREFPVKGEDYAYLIWRKRNCCAFAP